MPPTSNIVSSAEVEGDKGQRVRFIGGTHVKKKGWLRLSKERRGENQIYVLVDLGNDRVKKTYVSLINVAEILPPPTTWTEALLDQHTDVDAALEDLCRKLAKFDLYPERREQLNAKIAERLAGAISRQLNLGSGATWKRVVYLQGMNDV
jgi:hypothetical protein